jgi:hypothetical protein
MNSVTRTAPQSDTKQVADESSENQVVVYTKSMFNFWNSVTAYSIRRLMCTEHAVIELNPNIESDVSMNFVPISSNLYVSSPFYTPPGQQQQSGTYVNYFTSGAWKMELFREVKLETRKRMESELQSVHAGHVRRLGTFLAKTHAEVKPHVSDMKVWVSALNRIYNGSSMKKEDSPSSMGNAVHLVISKCVADFRRIQDVWDSGESTKAANWQGVGREMCIGGHRLHRVVFAFILALYLNLANLLQLAHLYLFPGEPVQSIHLFEQRADRLELHMGTQNVLTSLCDPVRLAELVGDLLPHQKSIPDVSYCSHALRFSLSFCVLMDIFRDDQVEKNARLAEFMQSDMDASTLIRTLQTKFDSQLSDSILDKWDVLYCLPSDANLKRLVKANVKVLSLPKYGYTLHFHLYRWKSRHIKWLRTAYGNRLPRMSPDGVFASVSAQELEIAPPPLCHSVVYDRRFGIRVVHFQKLPSIVYSTLWSLNRDLCRQDAVNCGAYMSVKFN